MNGYFIAQHTAFKNEHTVIDGHELLEVTQVDKKGFIEVAFDIGKTRHYVRFLKDDLESAIKEHKILFK